MTTNRAALWTLATALFLAGAVQAQYPQPYEPDPYDPGYEDGYYEDWSESDDWYNDSADDDYYGGSDYGDYRPSGDYRPAGSYRPSPAVEVGFFYSELAPYGRWVRHPYYGWVWLPQHVHANWRPYSAGRWVVSDYGWTWVSYEPFGWATYHYGRWAWDRYAGWLWVPGTDWAPAWVSWQQNDNYIGWAPLPPAVGFDAHVGIRLGSFSLAVGIAPQHYTFVETRRFLDRRVGGYIVPTTRNATLLRSTRNTTHYTVVDNRVINQGVPIERVERVTGQRAQRMRIAPVNTPGKSKVERDVVKIYRPAEAKLRSVKVAERNNAGLRKVAKPAQPGVQPPQGHRKPQARPSAQKQDGKVEKGAASSQPNEKSQKQKHQKDSPRKSSKPPHAEQKPPQNQR
jgi:hypothetical protein